MSLFDFLMKAAVGVGSAYIAYKAVQALAPLMTEFVKELWTSFLQSQTYAHFQEWCINAFQAIIQNGYQITDGAAVFTEVDRETGVAHTVLTPDGENAFQTDGYQLVGADEASHFVHTRGQIREFEDIIRVNHTI